MTEQFKPKKPLADILCGSCQNEKACYQIAVDNFCETYNILKEIINDPCGETNCTECNVGGCPSAPDYIEEK